MIKRIGILTKKPDLSTADFRDYWRNVHAPLIAAMPGVIAYRLNFVNDYGPHVGAELTQDDVDGIVEIWFKDRAGLDAAYATPEGQAALADIPNFIDRLTVFLAEERVIVGNETTA